MDCSCQPVIIVCYLDNSLLIIPPSEKLPFVNYIATNEAQMHSLRRPSRSPSRSARGHAQEPNREAGAGAQMLF